MVGNVNSIVESMFSADNVRNQQSTAGKSTGNFSDYLDSLLLNSRAGLLTGGLNADGSYLNGLLGSTGSIWQMAALKALRDELKKAQKTDETEASERENAALESKTASGKKTDWATIRVIRRYQSPVMEQDSKTPGILV